MTSRPSIRKYLSARDFMKKLRKEDLVFWYCNKSGIHLNYYRFIRFLTSYLNIYQIEIHGDIHLCIVENNIVRLINAQELSKLIVDYIIKDFPEATEEFNKFDILDVIVKTSPTSLEKNVLRFISTLQAVVKHDTKETCYCFFQNNAIEITADKVAELNYNDLQNLVFETNIIPRSYRRKLPRMRGEFKQFVWHLSGRERYRFLSLMTAIGYLLHQYKDPANPKIIILIDQIIGELETHNGGTGKSLVFGALKHIRNVVEISGKRKGSDRFLMQRVNAFTDIILINDVSRNDSAENYYNYSADDFTVERKYKNEVIIPASKSPKLCMTTNHMLKRPEGNSSERRLQEYEVSDYYSAERNPKDEFGHSLFYDWDELQWQLFDDFMIDCIQLYLQKGLISPPKINIERRMLLLEVGVELKEFLDEKIEHGQTKFNKKDTFDEFRKGGFIDARYVPRRNSFTRRIKKYMDYNHIPYREAPADKKLYIEIVTGTTLKKESVKSLKDCDVEYRLVDSANKLTRMFNQLNPNK